MCRSIIVDRKYEVEKVLSAVDVVAGIVTKGHFILTQKVGGGHFILTGKSVCVCVCVWGGGGGARPLGPPFLHL